MANVWMVRAGERGYLIDDFARGYVGIGWGKMGDMSSISSQEQMRDSYIKAYPDAKPGKVGNAAAIAYKFCRVMNQGDKVITYDPANREYLVGVIKSNYRFESGVITKYENIREVEWEGRVNRDDLSVSSRNSLGSTLTLFSVNEDVWAEISQALSGNRGTTDDAESDDENEVLDSVKDQSREFIKDKISGLGCLFARSIDPLERIFAVNS